MSHAPAPFWSRVRPEGDCLIWTGAIGANGYGKLTRDSRQWGAHRFAYTLRFGPIPDGLVLDHLCRVPACVNPDHLEPVTNGENIRRGDLFLDRCKNGHDLNGENGRKRSDNNGRRCVTCRRAGRAAQRARVRAMAA